MSLILPSLFYFVPMLYCFDYSSFLAQFGVREHGSMPVHQDCFGYWGAFVLCTSFRIYLFCVCIKILLVFDRDYSECVDCLGKYGHINKNQLFIRSISCVLFISTVYYSCLSIDFLPPS